MRTTHEMRIAGGNGRAVHGTKLCKPLAVVRINVASVNGGKILVGIVEYGLAGHQSRAGSTIRNRTLHELKGVVTRSITITSGNLEKRIV